MSYTTDQLETPGLSIIKTDLPCDECGYDIIGCCMYPDTPDDYCVMGDKRIPKKNNGCKLKI